MISRVDIAKVIGERTLHVKDAKELAREVAAYLLDTGRTNDLDSLIRDVMEYRAQQGVIDAEVVSAYDVTDATIRDIEDIVKTEYSKAKSVQVAKRIDPSVVGGVRVDMANEQLDLTIRNRIDTFKRLTANIKE